MIASVKPRSSITSASSDVHDADALVIDAGDPLAPQVGQLALQRDPGQHADDRPAPTTADATSGIGWSNGMAAQVSLPNMLVLPSGGDALAFGRPACGPGPGGSCCVTICWNSSGSTDADR